MGYIWRPLRYLCCWFIDSSDYATLDAQQRNRQVQFWGAKRLLLGDAIEPQQARGGKLEGEEGA
jgi:hypothetical protein